MKRLQALRRTWLNDTLGLKAGAAVPTAVTAGAALPFVASAAAAGTAGTAGVVVRGTATQYVAQSKICYHKPVFKALAENVSKLEKAVQSVQCHKELKALHNQVKSISKYVTEMKSKIRVMQQFLVTFEAFWDRFALITESFG